MSGNEVSIDAMVRAARDAASKNREVAHDVLSDLSPRLASTREEAVLRYRRFQRVDPFPEIAPGLLSAAAFCSYIAEVGMIFPARLTVASVSIATLDLPLLGEVQQRTSDGKWSIEMLGEGATVCIPRNSIAFVTLEPYLQLPHYIAMRFNLRVRNVYRGLLLGTGPLVDPGYQGLLSFPLHNLTDEDYVFTGGEAVVSVEFTKLHPTEIEGIGSANVESSTMTQTPNRSASARQILSEPLSFLVPFPEPTLPSLFGELSPISSNLRKAKRDHVSSSLPRIERDAKDFRDGTEKIVARLQEAVDKRVSSVESKVSNLTKIGITSLIALAIAIGAFFIQSFQAVNQSAREIDAAAKQFRSDRETWLSEKSLPDSLRLLRRSVDSLRKAQVELQVQQTRQRAGKEIKAPS